MLDLTSLANLALHHLVGSYPGAGFGTHGLSREEVDLPAGALAGSPWLGVAPEVGLCANRKVAVGVAGHHEGRAGGGGPGGRERTGRSHAWSGQVRLGDRGRPDQVGEAGQLPLGEDRLVGLGEGLEGRNIKAGQGDGHTAVVR